MSIEAPPPPTVSTSLRVIPDAAPTRTRTRTPLLLPARRASSATDRLLTRILTSQSIWLTPLLIVQAWFSFRLRNSLEEDEALYINAGHQLIAHMLHGTRAPDFGAYFSGVPSLYSVPAAMLDHVGGVTLVHTANTLTVMVATIFVYLTTKRLFGHPAALIAAAVFGLNPASIFVGRFASFDAPCLLLLAVGTYLAVRASDHWIYALATGPCLILAAAEKYFALAFIPSVFVILLVANAQRVGLRKSLRATAIAGVGLVAAAGLALLLVSHSDWQGFNGTSLDRITLLPETRRTLLAACVHYIGGLTLAGVLACVLLRRRWLLAVALLATSLIPALAQIRFSESASLHKNLAFGLPFLAPLVGVLGVALVRRGRLLALRVPVAVACVVLVLSSGMGTSAAMVHGWPNSDNIDTVLAHYVQRGSDRYLVDDSQIPEYYLSNITNYDQWGTTFDSVYQGPRGVQFMQQQLENGYYTLFLYRDEGSTVVLDKAMLSVLQRRYTLVAKVPLSKTDTTHFWYLWAAELPR
jgi:4-amino-4-deoxy-L-arabinose transferase-like glycosyltransferase